MGGGKYQGYVTKNGNDYKVTIFDGDNQIISSKTEQLNTNDYNFASNPGGIAKDIRANKNAEVTCFTPNPQINHNGKHCYTDDYNANSNPVPVNGTEYRKGQYTYRYNNYYYITTTNASWREDSNMNGWNLSLTDRESTDPVTTEMCAFINDYPVTSLKFAFDSSQATSIDFSSFDTSNVKDMLGVFYDCKTSILDLGSFDTSKVTIMQGCSIMHQQKVLI